MRAVRQRFWLAAMDLFFALTDLCNSLYFWALRKVAAARAAVFWLARHATAPRLSFPEIGRALNRDHNTVTHGAERAAERIDRDEWFAKSIRKLRAQLVPLGGDVDHAPVIPPTEFDARDALEVSLHG